MFNLGRIIKRYFSHPKIKSAQIIDAFYLLVNCAFFVVKHKLH